MISKKIVDITPDRTLITKMGKASHYDVWQALSELIDNAVDARINEVKKPVEISIQFSSFGGTFLFGNEGEYDLEVSDDGKGMNFEEFSTCLKLAFVGKKKEKKTRLGKFGLGLKTSVSSLGSKFKIISKAYKGNERYSLVFDEKDFIEKGDWSKFRIIKEEDSGKWHGTIIKIKSRKEVRIYKEKINRLKEKFSLQYSYLMQNDILKIKVNTGQVKPHEPELEKDPENAPDGKYPLEFTLSTGQKVSGWYGFRELGAKKSGVVSQHHYGLHIYWRQRLVAEYEKVGIRIHTEFQRLIGELHFEDFPVTHDKTNIIRDSEAYNALAGPRKEDDTNSRQYQNGELYKHLKKGLDNFNKQKNERIALYKEVDSAIENNYISLGFGRKLKNKIKKKEITKSTVKKIIQEEAKRTQEKLKPFLEDEDSKSSSPHQNISVNPPPSFTMTPTGESSATNKGRTIEDSPEYKKDPHRFEGWSLYYKRCSPEEADLIIVRDSNRKIIKYLNKEHKEINLQKYFKEQT